MLIKWDNRVHMLLLLFLILDRVRRSCVVVLYSLCHNNPVEMLLPWWVCFSVTCSDLSLAPHTAAPDHSQHLLRETVANWTDLMWSRLSSTSLLLCYKIFVIEFRNKILVAGHFPCAQLNSPSKTAEKPMLWTISRWQQSRGTTADILPVQSKSSCLGLDNFSNVIQCQQWSRFNNYTLRVGVC